MGNLNGTLFLSAMMLAILATFLFALSPVLGAVAAGGLIAYAALHNRHDDP